jgi:hypothetical protein
VNGETTRIAAGSNRQKTAETFINTQFIRGHACQVVASFPHIKRLSW